MYRKKGFLLVNIKLDEKSVKTGELVININEGLLEKVEFKSSEIPEKKVNSVFKKLINKPVNLRDTEQALENLMLSGKYDVYIDFAPGSKDGNIVLYIRAQKLKPKKFTLELENNYNNTNYSSYLDTSLDIDLSYLSGDIIFANDSFNIFTGTALNKYANNTQTLNTGFYYSLPLGYYELIFYNSSDGYQNNIEANYSSYKAQGVSLLSYIELGKTIARSNIFSIRAFGRFNQYISRNFLNKELLEASSYTLYYTDLGFNYQYFNEKFNLSSTFLYSHGSPLFGNETIYKNDYYIPQNKFNLVNLNFLIKVPLKERLSYKTFVNMQYSEDTLYPIKDFVVIGPSGIRGFDGIYSNWQSGFVVQNELNLVLENNHFLSSYFPYYSLTTAVDFGGSLDTETFYILNEKNLPLFAYYLEIKTQGVFGHL